MPEGEQTGRPQPAAAQQPHAQAYADDPMMRWATQQPPGYPPAAPAHGYPTQPAGPAAYGHDPHGGYAQPDPYAQPPAHPHQQHPQAYYQPVYHPDPVLPTGPDPRQVAYQPPTHTHPPAFERYPQPAPQAYQQEPPHQAYQPAPSEAQSWDLSSYAPGHPGQPQQAYAPQPGQGGFPGYDPQAFAQPDHTGGRHQPVHQGATHDPRLAQSWQQHPDPYAHQQYQPQPGYAPNGQPGFDPAFGAPGGQPPEEHQELTDEELHEEGEPRRRGPRAMVVVGALVGAIALGGGLAYGYRMLSGSGGKAGAKPPVVKADSTPTKVKPTDPGGKDVANLDKKFLNRFADDKPQASTSASASAPAAASAETEAPRKVTTLIVNKDGTITPQAASQPAAPPLAPTSSGVPGMVIEGLTPRPQPRVEVPVPQAPQAQSPPVTPVIRTTPPAAAPKVAELPLPKVKAENKKVASRDDAVAPAAGATAATATATVPTASSGGAVLGFVPVLTSKRSREDALKAFADLHQKYPDVLSGKSPDVMEANIPEKGVYYRLIVGPPGSRESARDVCAKLDAQGFKGCWATAYRQ